MVTEGVGDEFLAEILQILSMLEEEDYDDYDDDNHSTK